MSMGIGTNAQHPDEGELTRKLDAVACGVWFTSKGAAIPKMIKYQDEEGFVHSITHILQIVGLNGHLCHIRRTV